MKTFEDERNALFNDFLDWREQNSHGRDAAPEGFVLPERDIEKEYRRRIYELMLEYGMVQSWEEYVSSKRFEDENRELLVWRLQRSIKSDQLSDIPDGGYGSERGIQERKDDEEYRARLRILQEKHGVAQ